MPPWAMPRQQMQREWQLRRQTPARSRKVCPCAVPGRVAHRRLHGLPGRVCLFMRQQVAP